MPLETFHPAVRAWFEERFGRPSPPQAQGWPAIAAGREHAHPRPHRLRQDAGRLPDVPGHPVPAGRPAGARGPGALRLAAEGAEQRHLPQPRNPARRHRRRRASWACRSPTSTHAVRTGDTPQQERQEMPRGPPHILITTPESLYLLLTSRARDILRDGPLRHRRRDPRPLHEQAGGRICRFRWSGWRRSARARRCASAFRPPCGRWRKSPATWAGPARPVTIVDAGARRMLDLQVDVPVDDMRPLPESSIWPAIYRRVLELVAAHRSTIVFVNSRRLAERLRRQLERAAGARAGCTTASIGPEAREQVEAAAEGGPAAGLVATSLAGAGHRHGGGGPGVPGRVARHGGPRACSGWAGRPPGAAVEQGAAAPQVPRRSAGDGRLVREMLHGRVEAIRVPTSCLDVLAQQIVAMAAMDEWRVDELSPWSGAPALPGPDRGGSSRGCWRCWRGRYPAESSGSSARASSGTAARHHPRPGGRPRTSRSLSGGTIPDTGLLPGLPGRGRPTCAGRAGRGVRLREPGGRRLPARLGHLADREHRAPTG